MFPQSCRSHFLFWYALVVPSFLAFGQTLLEVQCADFKVINNTIVSRFHLIMLTQICSVSVGEICRDLFSPFFSCRFPWSRSSVSSPLCPLSQCPLWPRPCRATWGPWSHCCLQRSSTTPVGWCRSSAGRAVWVHSCRRVWRGEPDTTRTGSVSADGSVCVKCDRCFNR